MPNHLIDLQIASTAAQLPSSTQLQRWIDTALAHFDEPMELTIRIVDIPEMSELNQRYRHKIGPTNILSFPFEAPPGVELNLLGDLVVCAPVLEQEAQTQHKSLEHHWAHIIIHGALHLSGYDHLEETEAQTMETLEISILKQLSINNPYQEP